MIQSSLSQIPLYIHPFQVGKPKNLAYAMATFNWDELIFVPNAATLNDILYTRGLGVVFGEWDVEKWKAEKKYKTPRHADYFLGSNMLWYDFDEGLPNLSHLSPVDAWNELVGQLVDNPIIRDYSYMLIPSSSYTSALDDEGTGSKLRHHIGFKLDAFITDIKEYQRIWDAFALAANFDFKVDTAMRWGGQPLFGTRFRYIPEDTYLEPYSSENELSIEYLRTLPAPTEEKPLKVSVKRPQAFSSSGEYAVMNIPLESRVQACIEHIQTQPHKLTYPQWFVLLKKVWQASGGDERVKDALIEWFGAWDEADDHKWYDDIGISEPSEEISPNNILVPYVQEHPELSGYLKGLGSYLEPTHINRESDVQTGNIEVFGTQINIGAMGTSKTDYIPKLARMMQAGDVILVLSHRILLTNSLKGSLARKSDDVRVIHYTSKDNDLNELSKSEKPCIIVTTYNSVGRIYDTVQSMGMNLFALVMEEFGQSSTLWDLMKETARANYAKLETAIEKATYVMINDATAVQDDLAWLKGIRGDDVAIVGHTEPRYSKPPLTIQPAHKTKAIRDIMRWVASGKRIAVAFESKTIMWDLYNIIRDKYPELTVLPIYNPSKDEISIFQDEAMAFAANPDDEISKYQIILYTTKAGSGVSVTYPVDVVFVCFNFDTLTPIDVTQMVARFRNTPLILGYLLPSDARVGNAEEKVSTELAYERAQAARFSNEFDYVDLIGHSYEEFNAAGKLRRAHAQAIGLPVFLEALQRNGYKPDVIGGSFEPIDTIKQTIDQNREEWKQYIEMEYPNMPLIARSEEYRSDEMRELAKGLTPQQQFVAAVRHDVQAKIPNSTGDISSLMAQLDDYRARNTVDMALNPNERQKSVEKVVKAKPRSITNKQKKEFFAVWDRLMMFMSISFVFPTPDGKCEWESWPEFFEWASARGEIYDRLKGSNQRKFAELMEGNDDEEKAYKLLRAFAQFGGLKIRKKRVRLGDSLGYTNVIENLREALLNARARKYHRETDYALLQSGTIQAIPDDFNEDFPVSWSDVFASILQEFASLKEALNSVRMATVNEFSERIYAYVDAGYEWDTAHNKARNDMEGLYGTFAPPATLTLMEQF